MNNHNYITWMLHLFTINYYRCDLYTLLQFMELESTDPRKMTVRWIVIHIRNTRQCRMLGRSVDTTD